MKNPPTTRSGGTKSQRTRSTILDAAETLFAERGFAATRLEDVADAVELTRAALFYYYGDKQTLYDAMLEHAFEPLTTQLDRVLSEEGATVTDRIEQSVEAWVDVVTGRPTLARLILRIVADGAEQPANGVMSDSNRIPMMFWALFEQGRKSGEFHPVHDDPFHAASAVIGTSVFYVAALAALVPHGQFQPLDPQQIAAHKKEALNATRHLLGIPRRDD